MSGIHQMVLSGHSSKYEWEQLTPPSGSIPSGDRGGAAWLTDGTDFYLLGGKPQVGGQRTDLWKFTKSTRLWSQLSAAISGMPGVGVITSYINNAGTHIYMDVGASAFQTDSNATRIDISAATAAGMTGATGSTTNRNIAVDRANDTVYATRFPSTTLNGQAKAALSGTTITNTTQGGGAVSIYRKGGTAYCTLNNSLYLVCHNSASDWTMGTSNIARYDITANTGWVVETGVTNNTTSMSFLTAAACHLVWSPEQSLFYGFSSNGSYQLANFFTYDPTTKIVDPLTINGVAPSGYVLDGDGGYDAINLVSRGQMGRVCVQSDGIYFARFNSDTGFTNTDIWRIRFNF